MAEDLTRPTPGSRELPPVAEPTAPVVEEPKQIVRKLPRFRRPEGYGFRFMLAYALLGVILGGAAVAFAFLAIRGGGGAGGDAADGWSDWRPTAPGEAGVDQIAEFVAQQYRLPSGRQLVAVVADQPGVQQIPVSTVAIDNGTGKSESNRYTLHDTGGDFMYVLCGLGQNCAIREGKASVERHRLLRREALELALYTFQYVPGVDSVIAFLPPRAGQRPSSVLYFRKPDFKDSLDRPLRKTLPAPKPPLADKIPETERKIIDQLTTRHLFKYEFTQAQDTSAILILTPQAPAG